MFAILSGTMAFRLHVLELRLGDHARKSAEGYAKLKEWLNNDSRLKPDDGKNSEVLKIIPESK